MPRSWRQDRSRRLLQNGNRGIRSPDAKCFRQRFALTQARRSHTRYPPPQTSMAASDWKLCSWPPRTGMVSSAHRLQKHVVGRNTQPEAKRAIAIIRIRPVVTRFEREGGGDSDSLMAGARDLEENFLLTLQHDLPVV